MSKKSAGVVVYKYNSEQQLLVLLVHPGGPFYAKKDDGSWGIPKGEYEEGEEPLTVAKREFTEETGNVLPEAAFIALEPVKIKSGKVITAFAIQADFEHCFLTSNSFEIEWPPRSGKLQSFPEVDKAGWFTIEEAKVKINSGQLPILEQVNKLFGK